MQEKIKRRELLPLSELAFLPGGMYLDLSTSSCSFKCPCLFEITVVMLLSMLVAHALSPVWA